MKQKQFIAALFCATTPLFAHAANTLDEILVTATRTARSADVTLASVTVITRADIERQQAYSLIDLLRGVAGVTVSSNGGAGKAASVFMRGSNADHVLVLVDGVKIGSATTGTAAFQDIPLAQIERIEIVRGPRASLYGSEAIGGVIQIFTRKAKEGFKPNASVTAGSYGTYNSSVGLGMVGEQGWFNTELNQQNVRGFNACRGSLVAGCFTVEPDRDGYHNSSASVNAGYRFGQGAVADVQLLRANGKNQYDSTTSNQSESVQQVLGAGLKAELSSGWSSAVRVGRSQDEANNFLNGVYKSRFNTQRDSLSWQNDVALGETQLLSAGVDYLNDQVDSTTAYARTARSNRAAFAQYQGEFGAHGWQASARLDSNQQFGVHKTGGMAYGYTVSPALRLMASYGTAFKAPTFNQLYYPGFGSAILKPELAKSAELGVNGRTDAGSWSVHAYQTEVSNMIGFDALTFKPINIDTARLTGVEGQWQQSWGEWAVANTLTLQNPRQTSGVNQGKLLNRRATETLRSEVSRQWGDWFIASALYAEGRRFDDLANTNGKRLAGYGLLDVRAEYRIQADWLLQGRIDNVLDKQYETAQFFNQPGRGVYLTLSYQPNK